MLHAARQLPSWLIFDVGQNMRCAVLSLVVAAILTLWGCTSGPRNLERRRLDTIELIEKHYLGASNPFVARQARESLSALRSATPESLKVPKISFAGITKAEKPTLLVTWIEDSPSIDAVECRLAGERPVSLLIGTEEKAELKAESERTVHFIKMKKFEPTSDIARSVFTSGNAPLIEVRMRGSNGSLTDWVRVWVWHAEVDR